MKSAPASMTSDTSYPRFAKSADKIEGATILDISKKEINLNKFLVFYF